MIWSQHDPAAEAVANVNDSGTTDKTDNIWEGCSKSQDQNLSIDKYCSVKKSREAPNLKKKLDLACVRPVAPEQDFFTMLVILRSQEAIKHVQLEVSHAASALLLPTSFL